MTINLNFGIVDAITSVFSGIADILIFLLIVITTIIFFIIFFVTQYFLIRAYFWLGKTIYSIPIFKKQINNYLERLSRYFTIGKSKLKKTPQEE